MKPLILIFLLLTGLTSYGRGPMESIALLRPAHPSFVDEVVKLQSSFLKEKKWDHVMGIARVYRENLSKGKVSFRVGPFLMEAYSLIQFCRYSDARSVLDVGKYFAEKFNDVEGIKKLEQAAELEKLSQLYKNLKSLDGERSNFSQNELEWKISPENEEILSILDKVKLRTESLCQ